MAERSRVDTGPVRAAPLYWCAYAVVFMLTATPLLELIASVWPFQMGEARWRFGAAGLLSSSVVTVVLGLFLAVVVAFVMRQRRALQGFSALAAVLFLAVLVVGVLFSLDALQLRNDVRAEMLHSYKVSTAQALLKMGIAGFVSLAVAVAGFRADRRLREERAAVTRRTEASPLVVATNPR